MSFLVHQVYIKISDMLKEIVMVVEDHPVVEWYIPGPIDVNEEVLRRMSVRPYGHRTSLMSDRIK